MKVVLTGATGYIGKRLLPALIKNDIDVVCCVRDKKRFSPPSALKEKIEIIEIDFLKKETLDLIPDDIDGAYYLMHSMSTSSNYEKLEQLSAVNFREVMNRRHIQHVIYLSGIVNEKSLSKHLASRKTVESELAKGNYNFTTLRAGIIIGSGSASYEIIRDLVEKLPLMVAPKWLNTRSQPIATQNVIQYLTGVLFNTQTYGNNYDIGGPDILTYKEMLLGYAKMRGLKRKIFIVPVMTPKLSSYWLYFVTATSYNLATALVSSMKVEVICQENDLGTKLNIKPLSYEEALHRTLLLIEENQFISSWKDSWISGRIDSDMSDFLKVPSHGCLKDTRRALFTDKTKVIDRLWRIGGVSGWYFADWLWGLRGFIDKVFGGVGLRRGRTNPEEVTPGDAIDFWRVLYANKDEGRLLLFAEMKLPGEAWLEFKVKDNTLLQTATFRPKGIWGRLYWYSIYPLHFLVFKGMVRNIVKE